MNAREARVRAWLFLELAISIIPMVMVDSAVCLANFADSTELFFCKLLTKRALFGSRSRHEARKTL